jgi:hypothetical protein
MLQCAACFRPLDRDHFNWVGLAACTHVRASRAKHFSCDSILLILRRPVELLLTTSSVTGVS